MTVKSQLCAVVAGGALVLLSVPAAAVEVVSPRPALVANFAGEAASADVRFVAAWALDSGDNRGLPFAIVDKKAARIFVFEPSGRLLGASAALLGLAIGDDSVPGIGWRELSQILPAERTTPAGRFLSQPGRNLQGEEVVWVHYNEGLAIHRLRPDNSQERRLQRLVSSTPEDNRISLGCVIVPVAFYETVVAPILGKTYSVVYVLPETRPLLALFGGYQIGISQPRQP